MRRGELFPLRLVLPNGDKERRKKTKEEVKVKLVMDWPSTLEYTLRTNKYCSM